MLSLLVFVSLMSVSLPLYAGAYFIPGMGARAQGRAAAHIVNGTDPSAAWFNVANLAASKGLQLRFDVTLLDYNVDFKRRPDNRAAEPCQLKDGKWVCQPAPRLFTTESTAAAQTLNSLDEWKAANYIDNTIYPEVHNTEGIFPLPTFMMTWDMNSDDWVLGLAVYAPNAAGKYGFPEDGPQRYSIINSDIFQINAQVSLAGEFWDDRIRIGLGGAYIWTRFKQRLMLSTPTLNALYEQDNSDSEDHTGEWYFRNLNPLLDVDFSTDATDPKGFGLTGGFAINPAWKLWLATSFFYRSDIHARGEFKSPTYGPIETISTRCMMVDPDNLQSVCDHSRPLMLHAVIKQATLIRSGVGWKHDGLFDVELDFVYETWNGHNRLDVYTEDVAIVMDSGSHLLKITRVNRNLQDAWSLRMGGDYHAIRDLLTFRTGYFFEASAVAKEYLGVDMLDGDKHGFSFGTTVTAWGMDFDLALSYIFYPEIKVDNSNRYALATVDEALDLPGFRNVKAGEYQREGGGSEYYSPQVMVGNGSYKIGYLIVGMGITFHVDEWFDFSSKRH